MTPLSVLWLRLAPRDARARRMWGRPCWAAEWQVWWWPSRVIPSTGEGTVVVDGGGGGGVVPARVAVGCYSP